MAAQKLPPNDDLFLSFCRPGMTQKEIGAQFGVGASAVSQRLARIRRTRGPWMLDTPARPEPERLLLRVEEAAHMLGTGRRKVQKLINDGTLSTVQIGRARRIPAAELREWVAQLVEDGKKGRA